MGSKKKTMIVLTAIRMSIDGFRLKMVRNSMMTTKTMLKSPLAISRLATRATNSQSPSTSPSARVVRSSSGFRRLGSGTIELISSTSTWTQQSNWIYTLAYWTSEVTKEGVDVPVRRTDRFVLGSRKSRRPAARPAQWSFLSRIRHCRQRVWQPVSQVAAARLRWSAAQECSSSTTCNKSRHFKTRKTKLKEIGKNRSHEGFQMYNLIGDSSDKELKLIACNDISVIVPCEE